MRGICGVEAKAGVAEGIKVGNIAGRRFSECPNDSRCGRQANHTWAIALGSNLGACG